MFTSHHGLINNHLLSSDSLDSLINIVLQEPGGVWASDQEVDSLGRGLAATLKITVPRDISSWNVQVRFNKHFSKLSFFNALSDVSEGEWILLSIQKNLLLLTGSDFSLNNESWSGNKKEGDVIAFSLLGDYVDQDPEDPIMINYVSLNDQVYCSQE